MAKRLIGKKRLTPRLQTMYTVTMYHHYTQESDVVVVSLLRYRVPM